MGIQRTRKVLDKHQAWRFEQMVRDGYSRREIAGALGMTVSAVKARVARKGLTKPLRRFTPEEIERMKALHAEGQSCVYIGKVLDRAPLVVRQKLVELGLAKRNWRPGGQMQRNGSCADTYRMPVSLPRLSFLDRPVP